MSTKKERLTREANAIIARSKEKVIRDFLRDMAVMDAKYKPLGLNLVTFRRRDNVIKKLRKM